MSENVHWVLDLDIKQGELDNFKALMNEMVDATRADSLARFNAASGSSASRNCQRFIYRQVSSEPTTSAASMAASLRSTPSLLPSGD